LMRFCVTTQDFKPRWRASRRNRLPTFFEMISKRLLHICYPTTRSRDHAGGKRGATDISDTTGEKANVSSFGWKMTTELRSPSSCSCIACDYMSGDITQSNMKFELIFETTE
jgi:hypothetical protein